MKTSSEQAATEEGEHSGGGRVFRLGRFVPLALVAVAALCAIGWIRGRSKDSDDQYVVGTATKGTIRKVVSATGTIQPWTVVDIKSKAGGRIDVLSVELGDRVKKGQVIAMIDPSDSQLTVNTAKADIDSATAKVSQSRVTYEMQAQQSGIAVDNARAQVEAARASLTAAEARYKTAADESSSQPVLTETSIGQAEASLAAAEQELKSLDASQANDRATAQASLDQAKANYANDSAAAARERRLLEKGYVSQQAVDQQDAALGVAQAQLDSAKERMRTLHAEQLATRDAQVARVAQAEAALKSAKNQTDIQGKRNAFAEAAASVRQARAQLAQAVQVFNEAIAERRNIAIKSYDIASSKADAEKAHATLVNAADTLNQTTVRAPSDGVVLQKYLEQGTIITSGMSMNSTGTSIVQIGDISRLYVSVTVDETDIASVTVGQNVDVSVDAYPGVSFEGKVTRISPEAAVEQNVTTIAVRVEIDNKSPVFNKLKPNMNATCEFIVGERKDVVSVPVEALHSDDAGSYVEIATGGRPVTGASLSGTFADVKIERRPVKVGLTGSDDAEITSGLQVGERIVTQEIKSGSDSSDTTGSPISNKNGGPGGGGPPPGPPPGGGGK
jgi:HlyD family secretion protein